MWLTSSTINGPRVSHHHKNGRHFSHLTRLLETAELEELRDLKPGDLDNLRKRASNADQLERENRELRAHLAQKDNKREQDVSGQLLISTPINILHLSGRTSAPDSDEVDWKRQAAINGAKYSRINAEFQRAREALVRLKEDRDAWKSCAERQEKKIKALEAKIKKPSEALASTPSESTSRPAGRSSVTPPETNGATDETSTPARREGGSDRTSSITHIASNNQAFSNVPPVKSSKTAIHDHTSDIELPPLRPPSNEFGIVEPTKIKQEPSSDPPVVVSERSVRKRKLDETDTREADSRRVKREETNSLDTGIMADVCHFSPAGTLDLDEPSTRLVDTPRKRRAYAIESVADGVAPLDLNILQLRDPNIQSWKAREVPLKRGLSRALASVAEDGVVYKTNPTSRKQSDSVGSITPQTGKLKELLEERPTRTETPIIRSASRELIRRDKVSREDHYVPPRQLPFDRAIRKSAKQSASDLVEGSDQIQDRPTASSSAEMPRHLQFVGTSAPRLRFKPQSELRLDNFKINPKSNDGYRYAYSEVVRNRDERSKLPGCVDPACCGPAFRELALAERGTGPRTSEEQAADMQLLERFLGDESYRLFTMTKEEKDELWLKAKTQEIADRSGKHRHRFTRMRSPPGFWRTDFPSTQEIAEEKEEALRRAREAIQERYREAMKPEGRWKFRDE